MNTQSKRLVGMGLIIAALLLIPFVAMQFTDEVKWSAGDFVIMAIVLAGIGLAYELIARKSEKSMYRVAFGVGLLGALLVLWVNGAVGIIGNEGQTANLLYGVVFLIGLVGSFIARFEAKGMARTLFAAAGVQMLVPVIALLIWPPSTISWSPSVLGVFLITGFFAVLFVVSGMLFRQASAN